MADSHQGFRPDMLDEDLEQLVRQFPHEEGQLVHELRKRYSLTQIHSSHALERAWERIQREQAAARSFQPGRVDGVDSARVKPERTSHMQEIKPGPAKKGRFTRLFGTLAAAVLLVLVAGSLILAYGHLRPQTSVGSGHSGGPVTATPAQASVTPTQDNPTPGGTQVITNGQQSLNWPVGQSTYWANYRYHQLTGYWVSWTGNADQWVAGARYAGWHFSTSPHAPSIMVLMPYVQGAGGFGHVAVVESLVNSKTVHTSNMNWAANGGDPAIESSADFTVGSGVYFIWR